MKTFDSITIVGVGLIGGSVGLATRARGVARHVVGTGSRPATLEAACQLGAITGAVPDPTAAVAEAEMVVICAPVDHIVEQAVRLAPLCRPGTLITDAGSTKERIVSELEKAAGKPAWGHGARFVGSHPLAGNERRGPQHATADLFVDRAVVVTPTANSRAEDVDRVSDFWRSLGAHVVRMPADEHDRALAFTSHLPHLVAAAIVGTTPERYATLIAGGWEDTTRIAAGDPVLWRQILLANRTNLLESLEHFTNLLAEWRQALDGSDAEAMERLLAEAKRIRDAVGS
jgi:cyclohexadieny/prephenate dehydrogenase